MLIKFDPSKIEFKRVKLKSLNTLSGYLYLVDESITDKEKTIKYECPHTLVRTFKQTHKMSLYQVAQECCIMTYDNNIIAIEKAPINERYFTGLDGTDKLWTTNMETTYQRVLNMLDNNDWYIDGSYLYSFGNLTDAINKGTNLTDDGQFKSVQCEAIMINYIGINSEIYKETRSCLAFTTKNDITSITPPVWKSLTGIGNNNMNKDENLIGLSTQFDKVDVNMLVNLQFAISAGIALTKQFGYQSVEPLQLPKLMIQLKTVNLQSMPTEVKQTFDIGLKFTHAMAWLLGIGNKIDTYNEMLVLRKLFRYLTTTGIYRRNQLTEMFKEIEIPLLTTEQALANVTH